MCPIVAGTILLVFGAATGALAAQGEAALPGTAKVRTEVAIADLGDEVKMELVLIKPGESMMGV